VFRILKCVLVASRQNFSIQEIIFHIEKYACKPLIYKDNFFVLYKTQEARNVL